MFVTDVFDTHEHEPWTRVPFHTTRVHGPWAGRYRAVDTGSVYQASR